MKKAQVGDYLLWEGKLAKVIGYIPSPCLMIEIMEDNLCPHCNGVLKHEFIDVIESSPYFQEAAEPIPTIKE